MNRFADNALVLLDSGAAVGRIDRWSTAGAHVVVGGTTHIVTPEHVLPHSDLRDGERASAWCARLFGLLKAEEILTAIKVPA